MSYGMHDYLTEKAMKSCGMRKEAGAVQTIGKILSLPFRSKKGFTDVVRGIGIESADAVRAAHGIPRGAYTGNLPRGLGEKAAEKMLTHQGLTRAGIAAGEGAALAGVGTGAYAGGKALLGEDSYLDKALDLLGQYKGTALGLGAGVPAAGIAAMASKKNKLRNALLTGAITSLILGGAGYAYDRYNA